MIGHTGEETLPQRAYSNGHEASRVHAREARTVKTRLIRRSSTSSTAFVASAALMLSLLGLAGIASIALDPSGFEQKDPSPIAISEDADPIPEAVAALLDTASSLHGTIDTVAYQQDYQGTTYNKEAFVYVPDSYSPGHPANIVYLTHGWWGNAAGLADTVAPVVDNLEDRGEVSPTIVVFATYYPDRSFATEDYEDDYALNRFFATTEIDTLIEAVESRYTTFARGDTSAKSLQESRRHRAFGGFSMARRRRGTCLPCARSTSTGTCRWRANPGLGARKTPTRSASPSSSPRGQYARATGRAISVSWPRSAPKTRRCGT